MDHSSTYNPPALPPYPDGGSSGHSVGSAPEWDAEPIEAIAVGERPPAGSMNLNYGVVSHVVASPIVYDTNPLLSMRAGPGFGGGEWVQVQDTATGRFYWYNSFTRETTWENPHTTEGIGYHAEPPIYGPGIQGTAPSRIHNNINNNYGRGVHGVNGAHRPLNAGQICLMICCGCVLLGLITSAVSTSFTFSWFKTSTSSINN